MGEGPASAVADRLILDHLRWARAIAARMVLRAPDVAPFDAESAAYEGLIHAARTWSPTGGATFKGWAGIVIRGRVLDAWRDNDPLTRDERARENRTGEKTIDRSVSGEDIAVLDAAAGRMRPKYMPSLTSPEDQVTARIDMERLLTRLPTRLARVAMLRAEGYLLWEIAAELGVTESRACQLWDELLSFGGRRR